jgi:alcohol-forming fatty acyl-CoA reductase
LIIEGLGIDPAMRKILTEEVNLIINSAASVNFDDPLLDAIQINYFGCMRMMELAAECKNLLSMVHVSTAYVNANFYGLVEEKIYELAGHNDSEESI